MKLVFALLLAAAAASAAEAAASAKKRVDVVLCRREDYDDCTVYKDIEKRTCSTISFRRGHYVGC